MRKIRHQFRLHHIRWDALLACVIIYLLLTLSVNANLAAGYPAYYRALEANFSPIYFAYSFVPLLLVFLGYQVATPYWFTSFKEWALLRSKRKLIYEQLKASLVIAVSFVLSSWLLTFVILALFSGQLRLLPITTGFIGLYGPWLGMGLLLVATVLIDFGIMLLPLICNLFLRKKWQVLVLSILLNFFLPILLFTLKVLPEADMPINLVSKLTTAVKLPEVWLPFGYLLGLIIIEVIVLLILNRFRERTNY